MKVEINKAEEVKDDIISYPVIMEAIDGFQSVVMFFNEKEGFRLGDTDGALASSVCDDWIPCTNKSVWKRFEGKITIEN